MQQETFGEIARTGYAVLGNKRAGSKARPQPGEIAIDIDRKNPVLGNPYILHDHYDDRERADVIARYRVKYEADLAINGPMSRATQEIVEHVKKGQRIRLMCWCHGAPLNKPCHGDLIVAEIQHRLARDA